ncbi:MAG: hypothetical protein BMS9Abin07_0067 [Acidimicrobiia bacterium]|nr:MAG: hypothetical protein BMS9Abin07_0067 [Acidimicrobiia bacterium]
MKPVSVGPSDLQREEWRARVREAVLLLPNVIKLLARIVRDPRVPVRAKAFSGAVLVYVLSPIDLIPDFVIGFGQLDDIILSAVAIQHLIDSAGPEIVAEHWDGSDVSLELILTAAEMGAEIIPKPLRKMLPG